MVLVDTSVWIRFLANVKSYAAAQERLLDQQEVAGHELVAGELLIGDRGGRTKLLGWYSQLPHAALVAHAEVVEFVRTRRLNGLGLSWIDAHILASAAVAGFRLWTADASLANAAAEIGIEHTVS